MPKTGTARVDYNGFWNGYMEFYIGFDIKITISDDIQTMRCQISNMVERHSAGTKSGYGFWNYGGINWAMEPRRADVPTIPPNTTAPETPEQNGPTYDQLRTYLPELKAKAIFILGMSDSPTSTEPPYVERGVMDYTFQLGGVLPNNFKIINGFTRYYEWEGIPSIADRHAVIRTTDEFTVTIAGEGGGGFDWGYRPWAIRKSGQWYSCNREGGAFDIRKLSWRTITNDELDDSKDHAWVRKGGWSKAPKIGLFADRDQ